MQKPTLYEVHIVKMVMTNGIHSLRFQCTLGLAKDWKASKIFQMLMHMLSSSTIARTVIIYSNTTQLLQLFFMHIQISYTQPFVEIKTGSSTIISNEFFTILIFFSFSFVGLWASGSMLEPRSSDCSSWFFFLHTSLAPLYLCYPLTQVQTICM